MEKRLTKVESDGGSKSLLDGEAGLGLGGANLLLGKLWWCDWQVDTLVLYPVR
jgi:hypothetical protein